MQLLLLASKRPNIAELIYTGSVLKLLIFEGDEICTTHISVLADRVSDWYFTAAVIHSMTVYYCRAVETLDKGPDAEMETLGNKHRTFN
jgi:hypothetical protein